MEIPKISIITVSFNAVSTIEKTICSVLTQTYSNIEYIIIDGGSTDGTVDIIKKYVDKISYWVSEQDKGIYDAMNKGIARTNGEYIGIINADDWYELDAVEKITLLLGGKPNVIYGNMIYEKSPIVLAKPNFRLSSLRDQMILFHPSIFVRSDMYIKYGMFDIQYRISADWDLMLRLYENKCSFCYCDELISHFRVNGISSNFNLTQLIERIKLRYLHKNYSIYPIIKDLIIYASIKTNIIAFLLKTKHFIVK